MSVVPSTSSDVFFEPGQARVKFVLGGPREHGHSGPDLGIEICLWSTPMSGEKAVEAVVRNRHGADGWLGIRQQVRQEVYRDAWEASVSAAARKYSSSSQSPASLSGLYCV